HRILRIVLVIGTAVTGVLHNADNFVVAAMAGSVETEVLPNRILLWKEGTYEVFIHHGDTLRGRRIPLINDPAAQQGSTNGLEVVGTDSHPADVDVFRRLGTALDRNFVIPAVAVLRAVHGIADAAHARNLRQALANLAIEIRQPVSRVTRGQRIDLHHQASIGIEAEMEVLQIS